MSTKEKLTFAINADEALAIAMKARRENSTMLADCQERAAHIIKSAAESGCFRVEFKLAEILLDGYDTTMERGTLAEEVAHAIRLKGFDVIKLQDSVGDVPIFRFVVSWESKA